MFEKLKQLSKDTAVYGLSTIVGRFLNFILVPFYTNIFLPEEYGVVAQLYVFISIMNILMVYGMDTAYLRFAANLTPEEKKQNFSTPYIAIILAALMFCLITSLTKEPIYSFLGISGESINYLYYAIGILFFDAMSVLPFIMLRIERKARQFSFYKVLNIVIQVLLNIYLIKQLNWGIEAVFISNLTASIITFILFLPKIISNIKLKFDFGLLKKYLKFGLPYVPAGLAAMLIQGIDKPILAKLTDLNTVGIYNANYKLGIFMMLFVNMFQFAWQPFFLQNAEEKNAKEMFSKILTYFTIIGSLILIFLSLFIGDLIRINFFGYYLIGELYRAGVYIVPVVLFGYLFNGIYYIFAAGVYIKEKSFYAPIVTGIGALLNIAANFLLIPVWGIMGAAIATLISYACMAGGYFIVTQRIYKTEYEYLKLAKLFLFIFVIGGIYYFNDGDLSVLSRIVLILLFISSILFFVLDKYELNFIKRKIGLAVGKD